MGKVVGKLFGGSKPKGPDPELVAAQKKQAESIARQEAETKKEKKAALAVIAARGSGGGVTLNTQTGRSGISDKLGGGS
jgi:hypothetical protein